MSDHDTDEIRDLLARAMTDASEPHPWSDVEDRAARPFDALAPSRRRTGVWLGAAACTIALLGGLVAVVASDEPAVRTDDPTGPTVNTAPSTAAPTPTTTLSWTGGLLDDIDVDALRPLVSFTAGDAIVPTAPSGWRVVDFPGPQDTASQWFVEVVEAPPDGSFGQVLKLMTTTEATCLAIRCSPSGDSVTINGVEWEAIAVPGVNSEVFDNGTYLRARIGDRWVSVLASQPEVLSRPLLENPPIIEFLEGLRAGSPQVVETIGEACLQCAEFGKEGDPFADASRSGTDTPQSDGGPTETSERPVAAPSDAVPDTGRPLTELATGDVVVPTYIPPGLTLNSAKFFQEQTGNRAFSFLLERADPQYQYSTDFTVMLWENNGPLGPLGPQFLNDPNHPPVDIAGVTWGWNDFFVTRVAYIGSFEIWVAFNGLDRLESERLIEGLRAVPVEQFPVPISRNGDD